MQEITIDTKEAISKLDNLRQQLSEAQISASMRMAMNDATRWGKTRVKDAIREVYNIKSQRITDNSPKKGLSILLATNSNLTAKINAGHIPANLSSIQGTRLTKKGVSVEVKKGQRKPIQSAFRLFTQKGAKGAVSFQAEGSKAVIFARGKYGKPSFIFQKARKPIASMSSVSVATAALNTNAIKRYEPKVSQYYEKRLIHQLERAIDNAVR